MFTLKIENSRGELFELTHNSADYIVAGITGLAYPRINVNAVTGGQDGGIYGSSIAEMRNIVLSIMPRGDVEGNRQRLYKMFPPKEPCTVYFRNANRDVKIRAYVEVLDGDYFTDSETIQISLICPAPYFEAAEAIYAEISSTIRYFEFPFSISEPVEFSSISDSPQAIISNTGDLPCGVTITATFYGSVTGLTVYCVNLSQKIEISYTFQYGDTVTICTLQGSISAVLVRGTDEINMIPYISDDSEFFRLPSGESSFTVSVGSGDSGDVECGISATELFGGV